MDYRRWVLFYLTEALAGRLDQKDFHLFVAQMEKKEAPLLKEAMHELGHFLVDSDIRASDNDYDRLCRDKLHGYVARIGSSAT